MPNSITLAEKYLPILDEVYKVASKTAILEGANSRIRFLGGNAVEIFKTAMDGLADYDRNNGFVKGSVTSGWEKLTLAKDRGLSLSVDAMDQEETLDMCFGTLAGEFMRTKEVPEIDAYRFAKMASTVGITSANADITVGTTDVPGLVDTATEVMDDEEVTQEGRLLFVSSKAYNGLKNKITRYLANEGTVNRNVEYYNDMQVIRVPQSRFNTAITLYDGSGNFGFVPTAGGYKINFMIVAPDAVVPAVKHEVARIWTPAQNLDADAYKFDFRVYHDLFVLDNKVKGIYLHRASTANV